MDERDKKGTELEERKGGARARGEIGNADFGTEGKLKKGIG